MDLRFDIVHLDGLVEVYLGGEIDVAVVGQLRAVLDPFDDRPVVLDLSQVSYLDAAGIAVVVETDRRLRARDARLVLRHPAPLVRRLLEITGDDHLLEDGHLTRHDHLTEDDQLTGGAS